MGLCSAWKSTAPAVGKQGGVPQQRQEPLQAQEHPPRLPLPLSATADKHTTGCNADLRASGHQNKHMCALLFSVPLLATCFQQLYRNTDKKADTGEVPKGGVYRLLVVLDRLGSAIAI